MAYKRTLLNNAFFNIIKTLSTVLFPLITFMYASRILLPEGVGQANFAKSFVAYFTMFAMLGIVNYGTREGAQVRNDRMALSKLSHELLIVNVISVVCSYFLLIICLIFIDSLEPYRLLIVINSLTIALTAMGMEWLFNAIEEYRYIAIRTCIVQTLGLVAILIFVKSAEDILIYVLIQTLTLSGTNIINIMYSKRFINYKYAGPYSLKKHMHPILMIFSMTLFIQVFTHMDTTMLGIIVGDFATGLYTAAMRVSGTLITVLLSVVMVMMPRISYYVKMNHLDKIKNMIYWALNILLLLGIPVWIGLILLSEPIIFLFSGEAFKDAIFTARITATRVLLVPLNSFMVLYLFIPLCKDKWSLVSTGAAAIINFVLNLFIIPLFAQNGAAIATVIAELVELIINIYFLKEIVSLKFVFKNTGHYFIASIPIIVIYTIVKIFKINIYFEMLLVCTISIIVYFVELLILKNEVIIYFLDKIKNKRRINKCGE